MKDKTAGPVQRMILLDSGQNFSFLLGFTRLLGFMRLELFSDESVPKEIRNIIRVIFYKNCELMSWVITRPPLRGRRDRMRVPKISGKGVLFVRQSPARELF